MTRIVSEHIGMPIEGKAIQFKDRMASSRAPSQAHGYGVVMRKFMFAGGNVVQSMDIYEILPVHRAQSEGLACRPLSAQERNSLVLPEGERWACLT